MRYAFKTSIFLVFIAICIGLKTHYALRVEFPVITISALVISWVLIHFIEKRPIATLGLSWTIFTTRHFYMGLLIGAMMITFVVEMMTILGYATFEQGTHTLDEGIKLCADQFVFFLFAAAAEELVFRGYLYQTAIESSNPFIATIIFSAFFSVAHFSNPGITALAFLNIFLAGIWLSIAYLRTRQLWLPIALHTSWNFFQGTIFGADVSGNPVTGHLLTLTTNGPEWITGGSFGPEGGILTTIALIFGIIAVNILPQFHISPDQYALMHRVRYAEDYAVVFPSKE